MEKESKVKKAKKEKTKMGKKEKIFNIVSIIILAGLAIYFGSRAVYYAIDEYNARQNVDKSLAQSIINNNPLVTSGDGLYKDENGYYFVGDIEKNYVNFNNILYRIMGMTNENELILISEDNVSTFMWGNDLSYTESNVFNWLNETDKENSGIYANLMPNENEYLLDQEYTVKKLEDNEFTETNETGTSLITLISAEDYLKAGGEGSYIDNDKFHWVLGTDEDGNYLYVDENGKLAADISYSSYGIRPVIKLDKEVVLLRGKGEIDNPYIIQIKDETTYINSYITLGEDTYKVFEETEKTLKAININALSTKQSFGGTNSKFNTTTGIGNYLNTTYLNSLSYKDYLVDCTFNTGLINDDTSNVYTNMYTETVTAKVGMLNIFDYNNSVAEDYYYLTNTGSVSDVAYVNNSIGILNRVQINETKNIVPVICINKDSIIDGIGAEYSPYIVE